MYNRSIQEKIARELAQEKSIVLSTYGQAGLQVGRFACEAQGVVLFLLVPMTVDLRMNLDRGECEAAIATSQTWQAQGILQVLEWGQAPAGLQLAQRPDSRWAVLVELRVRCFEKSQPYGWGFIESIDLEDALEYGR